MNKYLQKSIEMAKEEIQTSTGDQRKSLQLKLNELEDRQRILEKSKEFTISTGSNIISPNSLLGLGLISSGSDFFTQQHICSKCGCLFDIKSISMNTLDGIRTVECPKCKHIDPL